jgi:uncharacterized cysteine cluster protein YcgN (CxxCxxCC family)
MLGRLYSDAEWEALCSRCGACCYESRWTETGWEETGVPCGFLDGVSKTCTAYGSRFEVEADCIRVTPSVVLSGILPSECSYYEELRAIAEEDHGADAHGRSRRARRRERRGRGAHRARRR